MESDWSAFFNFTPLTLTLFNYLDLPTLLILCHVCTLWQKCILRHRPSLGKYITLSPHYQCFSSSQTGDLATQRVRIGRPRIPYDPLRPAEFDRASLMRDIDLINPRDYLTGSYVAITPKHVYFVLLSTIYHSTRERKRQLFPRRFADFSIVTIYVYHHAKHRNDLTECFSFSLNGSHRPHNHSTRNICTYFKDILFIGNDAFDLRGDPCHFSQRNHCPDFFDGEAYNKGLPEYRQYPPNHLFALFRHGSAIEHVIPYYEKGLDGREHLAFTTIGWCRLSTIISAVNSSTFPGFPYAALLKEQLSPHNPFHDDCMAKTDPDGMYMWAWLPNSSRFLRVVITPNNLLLVPCWNNEVLRPLVWLQDTPWTVAPPNTAMSPRHTFSQQSGYDSDESQGSDNSSCTSDCAMNQCFENQDSPGQETCSQKNDALVAYISPLPVNDLLCILIAGKRNYLKEAAIIVDANSHQPVRNIALPICTLGRIRSIRLSPKDHLIYMTMRHGATGLLGQAAILNWSLDPNQTGLEYLESIPTHTWLRYRYPIIIPDHQNPNILFVLEPAPKPKLSSNEQMARFSIGKYADLCVIRTLIRCGQQWINAAIENGRFSASHFGLPIIGEDKIFLVAMHDFHSKPHVICFSNNAYYFEN